MKIPDPNHVVVSHYSEFHDAMIYQIMPYERAREHFNKLTMNQQSGYTIRPAELDDFNERWPKIMDQNMSAGPDK